MSLSRWRRSVLVSIISFIFALRNSVRTSRRNRPVNIRFKRHFQFCVSLHMYVWLYFHNVYVDVVYQPVDGAPLWYKWNPVWCEKYCVWSMPPYASMELTWCIAAAAEYGCGFNGSDGNASFKLDAVLATVPLAVYWFRSESDRSNVLADDGCRLVSVLLLPTDPPDDSRGDTLLGGVIALW